jgi:hypothetical protein
VEGREGAESKLFAGRYFQGIGKGIKVFKVLLKAAADLFFV